MVFLAYDITMMLQSDSNMVLWDDKGYAIIIHNHARVLHVDLF